VVGRVGASFERAERSLPGSSRPQAGGDGPAGRATVTAAHGEDRGHPTEQQLVRTPPTGRRRSM